MPTVATICPYIFCLLGLYETLAAGAIVGDSCANEVSESGLIEAVALTELDRSRRLSIQAGIEEAVRIIQGSSLEKVNPNSLKALMPHTIPL